MENSKNNLNLKASVIIPTYNRANLIGRTIKSILNQTYQDFEIVVVDDSPNDETEKVVKGFNDKRIKYIHNKEKTNLPKARNQGVRESSSDSKYIAFLDDDDQWLPHFLEKTTNALEKDSEIAMATTYARLMTHKEEILREIRCEHDKFWQQTIGSGCIIRKEIFTKENLWYDERKVIEDVDFGLRVLKNHKWKCIPEVLRIYHPYPLPRETSASSALPLKEIELFYEKHYPTYAQLGKKALADFYFKVGREFLKSKEIKKGRKNLLSAFLTYPNLKYFFYYLISLFFPKIFQSIRIRILKEKIFRGRI